MKVEIQKTGDAYRVDEEHDHSVRGPEILVYVGVAIDRVVVLCTRKGRREIARGNHRKKRK